MAASILKIGISQNANCDNLIGFSKSGRIIQLATQPFNSNIVECYVEGVKALINGIGIESQKVAT